MTSFIFFSYCLESVELTITNWLTSRPCLIGLACSCPLAGKPVTKVTRKPNRCAKRVVSGRDESIEWRSQLWAWDRCSELEKGEILLMTQKWYPDSTPRNMCVFIVCVEKKGCGLAHRAFETESCSLEVLSQTRARRDIQTFLQHSGLPSKMVHNHGESITTWKGTLWCMATQSICQKIDIGLCRKTFNCETPLYSLPLCGTFSLLFYVPCYANVVIHSLLSIVLECCVLKSCGSWPLSKCVQKKFN